MSRRLLRIVGAAFAASVPLLGVACLSSAPPAPPVRWFDPAPNAPREPRLAVAQKLRVEAPPHLGREFALRTGAREYAFDGEHQWIATPQELVAASLQNSLAFAPYAGDELVVRIDRFELDVTGAPRAVVALRLYSPHALGADAVAFEAPAADRSPAALAAAMASALGEVSTRVRAALAPR